MIVRSAIAKAEFQSKCQSTKKRDLINRFALQAKKSNANSKVHTIDKVRI